MDAGIFFLYLLKRICHSFLFQASPSLFLHLISTCPFISTNSGREENPGAELWKASCYVRSIQEWKVTGYFGSMHAVKDWGQDGTKYLKRDFWSIQAQSCRNTRDSLDNLRLKCQFSLSYSSPPSHFFHLHPLSEYIFTYYFCHPCFSPNFRIKHIKCFPTFPLLASPVIFLFDEAHFVLDS